MGEEKQTPISIYPALIPDSLISTFIVVCGSDIFVSSWLTGDQEVVEIPYGFLTSSSAPCQHFKSLDWVTFSHSFTSPKGNKQLLNPMSFCVVSEIKQNKTTEAIHSCAGWILFCFKIVAYLSLFK